MLRKTCRDQQLRTRAWILKKPVSQQSSTQVDYPPYRLLFSRNADVAEGSQIELIGRINDRSQCEKSSQIALIVQDYKVIRKIDVSPYYLIKFPVQTLLLWLNSSLQETEEEIYRFLPPEHSSLLLGVAIGRKPPAQGTLSTAMKDVGLMHVVVASGANIAIVVGFLQAAMRKFLSGRQVDFLASIVVFGYAVIVGSQAPIIRATMMFYVVVYAKTLGRRMHWFHPLLLASMITLIYQPLYITSLSFWLTVSATMGILLDNRLSTQPIDAPFRFIPTEFLSTFHSSFIVFLCTLPLLLFTIGNVSLVGIITNVLVVWMITPVTILGILLFLLSLLLPTFVYQALYLVLWTFLELFIRLVNLFSHLSFLTIHVEHFTILGLILYYFVFFAWVYGRLANRVRER